MFKFKIVCNKCGQTFSGDSEYDSEIEYNNHDCIENGSSLHDLTEEELIQIIKGEKTEEEIRKEKNVRRGLYNNPGWGICEDYGGGITGRNSAPMPNTKNGCLLLRTNIEKN